MRLRPTLLPLVNMFSLSRPRLQQLSLPEYVLLLRFHHPMHELQLLLRPLVVVDRLSLFVLLFLLLIYWQLTLLGSLLQRLLHLPLVFPNL